MNQVFRRGQDLTGNSQVLPLPPLYSGDKHPNSEGQVLALWLLVSGGGGDKNPAGGRPEHQWFLFW